MRDLQDIRRERTRRSDQLRLDSHADIGGEEKRHFIDDDSQHQRAFIA
jgi:hypothetical protein